MGLDLICVWFLWIWSNVHKIVQKNWYQSELLFAMGSVEGEEIKGLLIMKDANWSVCRCFMVIGSFQLLTKPLVVSKIRYQFDKVDNCGLINYWLNSLGVQLKSKFRGYFENFLFNWDRNKKAKQVSAKFPKLDRKQLLAHGKH